MNDIHIQHLLAADWQRVRSIRLRALADAPDAFCSTLADEQKMTDVQWQQRAGRDQVAQYVASTGSGHDVGMVVGAPYSDYENTAGLFGMWVDPAFRGRQIGKALIDAVSDWARNQGYAHVVLDVADDNTAAIRLYDACGFCPNGVTSTLPPPRQHVPEHQRVLHLSSDSVR